MTKKRKNSTPAAETVYKPRNLAIQLRASGGVEVVEIGENPLRDAEAAWRRLQA